MDSSDDEPAVAPNQNKGLPMAPSSLSNPISAGIVVNPELFLQNVREAFDLRVGPLQMNTRFRELGEWDSLTSVSLVAMIYACYDVQVSGNQIAACTTLDDLFQTIGRQLTGPV